jgi:hypothetical protein
VKLVRVYLAGSLAAVALAASGCGSDESRNESQQLPGELGAELAGQSDSVQTMLEHGDDCTAKGQARELRADVRRAIDAGRVPLPQRSELSDRAQRLVDSIDCDPQPPPPPPPVQADDDDEDDDEEGGRGKNGKRGKNGRGRGKEDD